MAWNTIRNTFGDSAGGCVFKRGRDVSGVPPARGSIFTHATRRWKRRAIVRRSFRDLRRWPQNSSLSDASGVNVQRRGAERVSGILSKEQAQRSKGPGGTTEN